MPVNTRGAIMRSAPGKWEVVDLVADDPQPGELQVKMAASGLCHSDDHVATGDIPVGTLPVRSAATRAPASSRRSARTPRASRRATTSSSRSCPAAASAAGAPTASQYLCDLGAGLLVGSRWDDPRASASAPPTATTVGQMCGLGTFAEITTVDVRSAVKIPNDIPLEVACLAGCGVGTGWGTAVQAGEVGPGDTVIVMGIGGIGINAVQGAAHAGASHVIAVDPVAFKREKAMELGATEAFESIEEAAEFARSVTNGQGADKAIVTVGVIKGEHVAQAFDGDPQGRHASSSPASATSPRSGIPITSACSTLFTKEIRGALFGDQNPQLRHPEDAAALPGGEAQARRADHHAVQARRHQPGLRGHARGQEHPRRDHLRLSRPWRPGALPSGGTPVASRTRSP